VGRERLFGQYGSTFIQSDDLGATWRNRDFPVDELVPDSRDAALLYGIAPSGGMRSSDGGASWVPWASQPCAPIRQLLASPTTRELLFMICTSGLYRSRDGGSTWTHLGTNPGQGLAADLGHPGRLLWGRDDWLWASDDAGQSWPRLAFLQDQDWRVALPLLAR